MRQKAKVTIRQAELESTTFSIGMKCAAIAPQSRGNVGVLCTLIIISGKIYPYNVGIFLRGSLLYYNYY